MRGKRILLAAVVTVLVLAITTVAIGATRHPHNGMAGRPSATPAGVIVGSCKAPKIDFATNDSTNNTSSSVFATIPGMSVTFKIAGTKPTCVMAEYSGQAFAPNGALLDIEAVLDGATVAAPGEVQLTGDSDENANGEWSRSHAMQFAWPSVPPGAHTVTIAWRSFFATPVTINRGTLLVHHK
jgi:hypothetical protein